MSILVSLWAVFTAFVHSVFFWPVFELTTVLAVWFALIRPALKNIKETDALLTDFDNATRPFWRAVVVALEGLWTRLWAAVLAMFAAVPALLDKLTGVKWEAFFNVDIAAKVTAGIALATLVVHAMMSNSGGNSGPPSSPVQ